MALISPHSLINDRLQGLGGTFNVLVGKASDALIKALDAPLVFAINWGKNLLSVARPP